jgi:hypothetical protein
MGDRVYGPTVKWVIADKFKDMSEYGIPPMPTNTDDDGNEFMTAENPIPVVR